MSKATTTNVRLPQEPDAKLAAQLALFCLRASQIFEHVLAGRLLMIDAADMLHTAACASGLSGAVGEDNVQKMLAAAFASAVATEGENHAET